MDIDISTASAVWFIIGIIFFVAELALPGFILLFFGIGAWVTALSLQFGLTESIGMQVIVFLAFSILSLLLFRKKWSKYFSGRIAKPKAGSDMDNVHGKKALALSDIMPGKLNGKVELFGTEWEARSDQDIKEGDVVEIIERKNLVLKVKKG